MPDPTTPPANSTSFNWADLPGILQQTPNFHVNPGQKVPVISPDGTPGTIDSGQIVAALGQGFKLDTPMNQEVRQYAQDNSGVEGAVKQFAKSGFNNLLFGIPETIAKRTRTELEQRESDALSDEHPVAQALGGVAGLAGNILATGGVVGAAGDAARAATGLADATSIGGQALGGLVKGATIGGLYAAPQATTDALLNENYGQAAENVLMSGILGGVLGGTADGIVGAASKFADVGPKALQNRAIKLSGQDANPNMWLKGLAMAGKVPNAPLAYGLHILPGGTAIKSVVEGIVNTGKFLNNPEALNTAALGLSKMAQLSPMLLDKVPEVVQDLAKGSPITAIAGMSMHNLVPELLGNDEKEEYSGQHLEELTNNLGAIAQNPQVLPNLLAPILTNVPTPVAIGIGQKMGNAASYLNSVAPKPVMPKNPLSSYKGIAYNPHDVFQFQQKLGIVNNPSSILNHLANRTLIPAHVEAMQAVYPELLKNLQGQISDHLTDELAENPKFSLPYVSRQQLGLFMAGTNEPSLQPQSIQMLQSNFAQKSPAQQGSNAGGKVSKSGLGKITLADQTQTDVQQHETGDDS